MSFAQAIAQRGINETRELENLRARTRYHARLDRPKIWASCRPKVRRDPNGIQFKQCIAAIQEPESTEEYVAAWCWLNWLKL